jgi:hypothetical protein
VTSTPTPTPSSTTSEVIPPTSTTPSVTSQIPTTSIPTSVPTALQSVLPTVPAGLRSIDVSIDDPRIVYSPADAWTKATESLPSCVGDSGARTSKVKDSSFSFPFNGVS